MRPYDTEPPNTKLRATQICRSAQQPTKEPQLSKRGAWRLAIAVGTLFPTASLMITVRLELVERGSFDVHQVLQWRSKPESSTAGPVGPSASGDRACTRAARALARLRSRALGSVARPGDGAAHCRDDDRRDAILRSGALRGGAVCALAVIARSEATKQSRTALPHWFASLCLQ